MLRRSLNEYHTCCRAGTVTLDSQAGTAKLTNYLSPIYINVQALYTCDKMLLVKGLTG